MLLSAIRKQIYIMRPVQPPGDDYQRPATSEGFSSCFVAPLVELNLLLQAQIYTLTSHDLKMFHVFYIISLWIPLIFDKMHNRVDVCEGVSLLALAS